MAKEGLISKPTQCDRVLDYIATNGSITAWQAMQDLGIMQLAARVFELKKKGYNIVTETKTKVDRYGDTFYYKVYFLEEKEEQMEMTLNDDRQLTML